MTDNLLNNDDANKSTKSSEVLDFAQALFHSAVEKPFNGVVQIVNKSTNAGLPELDVVGASRTDSLGTSAGNLAGTLIDYAILSKVAGLAMGNLGGSGLAGNALRAGIVGGVYAGVFTPSDSNSNSFLNDRVTNAGIGAATFASMAAASDGLGKVAGFAVPQFRSLTAYVALGAASGAAGGLAHAESSAILKDRSLVPSPSNLANDIGSYAAFGAAFGALGYAASKFGPENTTKDFIGTKTYNNGDTAPVKGQLTLDADGKPIQFSGELPPADPYAGGRLRFESTKLMNGSWKTTSPDDYIFVIPKITDVQFDAKAGTLNLVDAIGDNRLFGNDGVYTISNPVADAKAAADVAKWNERIRQVYEDSLDRVTNGERKNH